MWDYQEGSIFDPYAFQPKPKKPMPDMLKPKEKYRPQVYRKPVKIEWSKLSAKKTINQGIGLFQQFQRIQSPEYQLRKTRREMKSIEAKKQLIELRREFDKEKANMRAEQQGSRQATINAIKSKLGFKQETGFGKMDYQGASKMPSAEPIDRLDEVNSRYNGKNKLTYRSDKEKYEHQY